MNKKKILFVASVPVHFHAFHRPYMKWFFDNGYEVHAACNGSFEDQNLHKLWHVDFERSPFSFLNFKSFQQLKRIIDENNFALITCHTPMASVITRLAGVQARQKGTKILYTAHGFHFFKGASTWSWLTYFPAELMLTKLTDAVICINDEDFSLISKNGCKSTSYYKIPGIGVSSERFRPISKIEKMTLRKSLGFSNNDFIMIYAAEFINRKNHKLIIDAIHKLSNRIKNFKVLFAGRGVLLEKIKNYALEKGVSEQIEFLGFVTDIEKYYQISDIALSSSKQEGLGINLIEAMMCGLPVVATIDRGHCTIIDHKVNGILYPQNDFEKLSEAILEIHSNNNLYIKLSNGALNKASYFDIKNSLEQMSKIYRTYL